MLPSIDFAIPKSVSLMIGGRSSEGFSANRRFSGFKSCKKSLVLNLIPRVYQHTLLSKQKLIVIATKRHRLE